MVCLVILIGLLGLSVSYVRMQRSLRWWQARQSARQCNQAEAIRDGVLQDSFAMRRSLELALTNPGDRAAAVQPEWLTHIEMIQQALEAVSNQLSPVYLQDNLPLAMRSMLEKWQQTHGNLRVETTLPQQWSQDAGETNRVVLIAVDELLQLIGLDDAVPMTLQVSLQERTPIQEVVIRLSTVDRGQTILRWNHLEFDHLQRSFHCLTSGRFYRQIEGTTITWHFRWRSQPRLFPL